MCTQQNSFSFSWFITPPSSFPLAESRYFNPSLKTRNGMSPATETQVCSDSGTFPVSHSASLPQRSSLCSLILRRGQQPPPRTLGRAWRATSAWRGSGPHPGLVFRGWERSLLPGRFWGMNEDWNVLWWEMAYFPQLENAGVPANRNILRYCNISWNLINEEISTPTKCVGLGHRRWSQGCSGGVMKYNPAI